MKTVIANKTGFYGGALVFAGSTFEVDDEEQARWFDDLNPPAEVAPEPEPQALSKSRKKTREEASDLTA